MRPATYALEIYQGDTFEVTVRLRTVVNGTPDAYMNLTGYTGKAQVRETIAAPTPAAEFAVTVLDQVATPGGVKIALTAAETAAIPVKAHVWDLQLTSGAGATRTWLKGDVTIIGEVTRL